MHQSINHLNFILCNKMKRSMIVCLRRYVFFCSCDVVVLCCVYVVRSHFSQYFSHIHLFIYLIWTKTPLNFHNNIMIYYIIFWISLNYSTQLKYYIYANTNTHTELPVIGTPNWYLMCLLSPYAGIYYWRAGDRVDEFSIKLVSNDEETENSIDVQGSEDEIERMWKTLDWQEKGMVKVAGLMGE